MPPIYRLGMRVIVLIIVVCPAFWAQDSNQRKDAPETKRTRIWVFLKSGEFLTGYLIKADNNFVEIEDKYWTTSHRIPTHNINHIRFGEATAEKPGSPFRMPDIIDKPVERPDVIPMNENLRPEITYKERPGYTQEARDNGVQGTVVLNVIFEADGTISRIRVVRGLPDGLVERAIEATRKIKFKPAIKDGQPVSVRGNLEYKFTL